MIGCKKEKRTYSPSLFIQYFTHFGDWTPSQRFSPMHTPVAQWKLLSFFPLLMKKNLFQLKFGQMRFKGGDSKQELNCKEL